VVRTAIGPIHGRSLWAELKAYAGSRGSTFLAAAVIIAGQAWLVNSLAFRPAWVFPVLSTVLLLGSAVAFRSDRKEPSVQMRWLARGIVGVLALANAVRRPRDSLVSLAQSGVRSTRLFDARHLAEEAAIAIGLDVSQQPRKTARGADRLIEVPLEVPAHPVE